MPESVLKKFTKAVEDYREEIIRSYYSRYSDDDNLDELNKEIRALFKKVSRESVRKNFLYISLRTISRPSDEERLDNYLNRLAHELDKKLTRNDRVIFRKKSSWQKDDCINQNAEYICKKKSTIEAVYDNATVRCCTDKKCKGIAARIARASSF